MKPPPSARQSVPLRDRVATVPRMDVTMYRPGPLSALITIFLPVLASLVGAAIAFGTTGAVPVWLPLLLLLWIPFLPLDWLMLRSVRVDAQGIAAAQPWQRWHLIPWHEIRRVEVRLGILRVVGETGEWISMVPLLLRDGARLERSLLMRLPSHVLSDKLRQRAQQLIIGDVYPTPTGGLSGMLRARPLLRWRVAAALMSIAGVGGALFSLQVLSGPVAIVTLVVSVLVVVIGLCALLWLSQGLFINEHGIEIGLPLLPRMRGMRWRDVELIESTRAERLLRLRSHQRLLCPGPGLLRPADRNAMRAFIHEYCLQRKVPLIRRRWLI
jgi:hypothetical protein